MNEQIVDEFYKKIIATEKELHTHWLTLSKEELIKEICNLAYKQNFVDALIYYCENFDPDDGMVISVHTVKFLLEYKENIINFLADTIQNFRHFERYNLNDWDEELPALIESCIDYAETEEERKYEQRI